MKSPDRRILIYALSTILTPVIRFCIRHSLKFQDLVECAKACFVKIAREELETKSQAATDSRLSLITGLNRRNVMNFKNRDADWESRKGVVSKVIGQWQTDTRFLTAKGEPKVLKIGPDSEFAKLVQAVSTDLNPATVQFELERINAVSKTSKGLKLLVEIFVPKGDVIQGLNFLGMDVDGLIGAAEENLFDSPAVPNLHLAVAYDKIRASEYDNIRSWLLKEGNSFLIRMRDYVSRFDQDVNPDTKYKGKFMSVILGTFSKVRQEDR